MIVSAAVAEIRAELASQTRFTVTASDAAEAVSRAWQDAIAGAASAR
jgi:hypothetical protein